MSLTKVSYTMIEGTTVAVEDFGAVGDGVTDDTAAILAAINGITNASATILFQAGKNYLCSGIVMPNTSGNAKAVSFKGTGAGGYYMATITYTGTSGTLFDFTNCNSSYVAFENLYITSGRISANTTVGTAIKFGGSTSQEANYSLLVNCVFEQFNIAVHFASGAWFFYSKIDSCRFLYSWTAGIYADSNLAYGSVLFNGATIQASQFSQTKNGSGAYLESGGAGVNFVGCYFEGNKVYGLYLGLIYNASLVNCYAEANGDVDIYYNCSYAGLVPQLTMLGCYLDPSRYAGAAVHPRVWLYGAQASIIGCKFFTQETEPVVFVYSPIYGGSSTAGNNISVALNNTYGPGKFTNLTNDYGWVVFDAYHPAVQYSAATPAYQTIKAGQMFFNTDFTANPTTYGWITTSSGRLNAPNPVRNIANTAITGSTTLGVSLVTFNDTALPLYPGDVITVAGTSFQDPDTLAITAFATILSFNTNNIAYMSGGATATVVNGAVNWQTGTISPITFGIADSGGVGFRLLRVPN